MSTGKEIVGRVFKRLAIATVALWTYYAIVPGQSDKRAEEKYDMPQTVQVIEAEYIDNNGLKQEFENLGGLEKTIETKDIDFDKNFEIKTSRYTLSKNEDWWLSTIFGHVASVPGKIFFMDWDYGLGLDEDRSKAAFAMLENNTQIKDITVRINHNEVWKDFGRLFTDEKLEERNPFLARVFIGIPTVLGGELFAELSRGAYYNPMTNTSVCYANIESINAHEIGHHMDFRRWDTDWIYSIVRPFPPVMLYQEWAASTNAKSIMAPEDKDQFMRYLIPAFGTYILATYGRLKKFVKKLNE